MIRDSFELAKPSAEKIADRFYVNLWGDFPLSKPLFEGVDMAKQKSALVSSLVQVVDNLDQPTKLENLLHGLGERHTKYGTEIHHYEWVGVSLLKTFGEFFGDAWTPTLKDQWSQAYQVIADTMKAGARTTKSKAEAQVPLAAVKLESVKRIQLSQQPQLHEMGIHAELPLQFKTKIRETIQKLVEKQIEAEIENALRDAEKQFDTQLQVQWSIKKSAS